MKIYTKKHLLETLTKEGLPSSYKSLMKYEKLGVVPVKGGFLGHGSARNWRLYTKEEIDNIVDRIREYKEGV